MDVWLALAIAARPDLLVLGIAAAAARLVAFRTQRARLIRAACAFAAPLVIIGAIMLWYNAARFGDPLEFGVRYQLTSVDMRTQRMCGVRNIAEAMRLVNNVFHYVFLPPVAQARFPFLDAQTAALDPAVSWPTPGNATEQVIGLAPLMPLAIIGSALALLFALVWRGAVDSPVRAAMILMAGAWLVLAALSTCWWIVARYSLDFTLLMVIATAVCIERGLSSSDTLPLRAATIILAVYSILLGTLLGFEGLGGAFRSVNPTLFKAIGKTLHVKVR